jgi:primosomal protein N' (replication factor Y)
VIVDISHAKVDRFFEYIVPDGMEINIGSRVRVPFANKIIDGFVLELSDACDFDETKIKQVSCVLKPFAALTEDQIALAQYLKEKYNTTLAAALRLMLPAQVRKNTAREKKQRVVFLAQDRLAEAKKSLLAKNGALKYPRQMEVLQALEAFDGLLAKSLNASALKSLLKKGFVFVGEKKVERRAFPHEVKREKDFPLTQQQEEVLGDIFKNPKGFFLLHGVTGSGKTEVYIRLIRECLAKNKSAIMLVPEISLTPQTYLFLKRRFSEEIAVFHSGLSAGERLDEWLRVKQGRAKIVLGARSAVFAPVCNLGAIIIDEAHENSYQADNYPNYSALEIAEKRCRLTGATLLLGSATPSVETYYAAKQGRYNLLKMPERMFSLRLPHIQIADMRAEIKKGNTGTISGALYKEIDKTLQAGKQAMLFLNRRGYSTFVMCRSCGYTVRCSACDVTMTYHRDPGILKCHYCGRSQAETQICPECGKPYLKYFGMGTQQVEEEVKRLFPGVRVIRMDLDTMTTKDAHNKVYNDFIKNKADILIGTQMITKGFDFENVRLSAVIAAETMLNIPDYRSAERAFMLMTQVAGRAGRKEPGEVVLQTYNPDNYVIRHAQNHDYEGFYQEEISLRKLANLPPFTAMIQFMFSGKNENKTIEAVRDFLRKINAVMGADKDAIISIRAGEAPIKRINQIARYVIYLTMKKNTETGIQKVIQLFRNAAYDDVMVGIEMNPMNLQEE